MADQQPQLDSLFLAALEIESPEERAAFLDSACGADADLRREVERLLRSNREAGSFLERPAPEFGATVVVDAAGNHRMAVMQAGLSAAFDENQAVVVGNAGLSVLKNLDPAVTVSRVALREPAKQENDPIVRPKSPEMPGRDSDSRYQLQGEIARGGMGAILKGRDTDLGRELAIKVLLESHKDKPDVVQRFIEEAQIGGQLQHPGIAPIYELGQFSDRRPFFSMKLVKGETLSKLLSDRADPSVDRGRFIGIFEQVCQTMAYAHSRGVIHRDLKPANIMVGAFGEVQVMDWGLAKVLPTGGVADEKKAHDKQQGQSIIQTLRSKVGSDPPGSLGNVGTFGSQTQMGSIMGTPAYMPPEQALGEIDNLDERADVFGLGAILCEILTGQPPYVASDGTQVYRMASRGRLTDCFARLDACRADAELIAITKQCLELEPVNRPRDAGVLAERVTAHLASVESRLRATELERAAEAARAEEALHTAKEHEAAARAERRARKLQTGLAAVVVCVTTIGGIAAAWTATYQSRLKNAALMAREAESQQLQRAEREKARAESEKLRSDKMLTGLAFERGLQQCQAGNVVDGLLWMVESLAINPAEDHDFANLVRWNLAGWSAPLARQRRILVHEHSVNAVAYSPNGKTVVTAHGGVVSRWDSVTGERVGQDFVQPGLILCVAFSPDGQLIATGTLEKEVRIWDLDKGEMLGQPIPQPDEVNAVAFNGDGRWLAVATGYRRFPTASTARVWDVATGQPVSPPLPHPEAIRGITFHFNGTSVITGCLDRLLRTWDVSSGQFVGEPFQFPAPISALAISDDRAMLAVGCLNGDAFVYFVPQNALISPALHHGIGVDAIAFHPNLGLVMTGGDDRCARVWEWNSGELVGSPLTHQNYVHGVAFSPDGRSFITGSQDTRARLWDLPLASHTGIPLTKSDRALSLMHYDQSLVSGRPKTKITGPVGQTIPHWVREYLCASFSPDGRYVVTGSTDHNGYVWEVATGRRVCKPLPHLNWVRGVAFSPDSRRVLTASHDMTARLWDIQTGEPIGPPLRHTSEVVSVAFSPDGQTGLTGGRTARLWNLKTGEPIGPPMLHPGVACSVSFSRDGRLVLTISTITNESGGEARLWDAATAKPIGPPIRHHRAFTAGRFDDDGRSFLTLSDDGAAWRWPILPPIPGEVDLVRLLTQSITGKEHDAGQSVTTIEPAVWHERRARVMRSDVTSQLDGGPESVLAWHDGMAGANEINFAGGAALWHLERLIQARPQDWSLRARRAGVYHRYQREAEALDELKRAIELGGLAEVRGWGTDRAENYERIHLSSEALWFRQWDVTAAPKDPESHAALGHCLARLGRFGEASQHFRQAVTLAPQRIDFQRDLAMAQLAADDRPSYRKTCERLIELAKAANDLESAHMAALTCVLDAECVSEWDPVVRLAARCAEGYEGDRRGHVAALLRAGQIDDALEKYSWSTQTKYTHIVWEGLFQGMLRLRAGRVDEGRSILEEKFNMIDFMDQAMPRDLKSTIWSDWIYHVQCHVLRREAETRLKAAAQPAPAMP